jgi:DNA-binding NarL/FixJ family response regulator
MSTPPVLSLAIVVAAAAGIQRDALVSLLRAQPLMTVVAVTNDLAAVRRHVEAGAARIIVLDGGLELPAALHLVAWLRQSKAAARCIVLAESTAQRRAFLGAGADEALLKGCLDEHLLAVLRRG